MPELRDPHGWHSIDMTSPDGVRIRQARVDDAEALAVLHHECWDDAYTGLVPQQVLDDWRRDLAGRVERWRQQLGERQSTLLAEADDGPVGFVRTGPGRDDDIDLGLELIALYVRAAWWSTGLGRSLFEQAMGDLPAYLWVVEGNARAIRFYERQGFRRDGSSKEMPEGLHVRMIRR
jgi:GNAT superfamily N-acetyltransferase